MGDSKSPMYFIAIACVINIGLDYLFMGVMHMGPVRLWERLFPRPSVLSSLCG